MLFAGMKMVGWLKKLAQGKVEQNEKQTKRKRRKLGKISENI